MRLFDPIVPPSHQHQHFRTLLRPDSRYVADVLNDWARGFQDRDGKFVEEFQTTFNSSFWELYVYAVLKKYGLQVDFTHARPDFSIPSHGLNIEATVASNAAGTLAEHERAGVSPPADLNAFNFQTIVRMANSLSAKRRKYIESYQHLAHVKGRAFVVALANFDKPFSFMAGFRALEALLFEYYVDEEKFIAGQAGSKLRGEQLKQVLKDNGSPVELGLFMTPAYKEISAVIYSSCATWGKARALSSDPLYRGIFTALRYNPKGVQPHRVEQPKHLYEESLLDGLRVYYNPYAEHPLDPALFRHPHVFQSYFANDDWQYEWREGQLLYRSIAPPKRAEIPRSNSSEVE